MYKRFVNISDIIILPITNRVDVLRYDGLVKNIVVKASIFFKVVADRFMFKSIESRDLFRVFWIILANNFKTKFVYFADVSIMGLGYRVRLIGQSIFRLFLGKTNFIYFFATNDLLFRSFSNDTTKVRKILVVGFSQLYLNNCLAAFLLLRPLNPYRVTGILDSRKFIYLKTGKRR